MTVDDEPQITQLSSRTIVRRMFEELSDNLDEFSLPGITDEVFGRVKADPDLLARLIEDALRPLIYDIGLGVMASQRARRSRAAPIRDAIASLPVPAKLATSLASSSPPTRARQASPRRGFDWLRQPISIAPRQTVRLRKAVKDDLERAIRFGGQNIESTRVSLAYYELIAEGLASPTQTVAERYADADLAYLWQRAERRVATENRVVGEVKEKIAAQKQAAIASPQPTT
jgi:hypothetical protein